MNSFRFELFLALRYLRAKRKQAVISVITVLTVMGVAAGVMALIIALAINNGFRGALERTLLAATAHVSIMEKQPNEGIKNWREVIERVKKLEYVESAAPSLFGTVFVAGPLQAEGAVLKGIDLQSDAQRNDLMHSLKQGSIEELDKPDGIPGIVLGTRLAQSTGMLLGSRVKVISPQGELTPFGPRPAYYSFRVVGIFETGFYEFDRGWAFTSIGNVQKVLSVGDVANAVEVRVKPLDKAVAVSVAAEKVVGPGLGATHWMEQNRQILNALKLEKAVTTMTIGLILLVAALSILISQVMMVMEKHRDIAVLMSMGARKEQIRRIFIWQGALIGLTGTVVGLVLGYGLSYFADRGQWIRLDEQMHALSYVPFEARWIDALWVAGGALLVSVIATLYPARNATRIYPVEALRYE